MRNRKKKLKERSNGCSEENVPTESSLLSLGEQTSKDIAILQKAMLAGVPKPSSQIESKQSDQEIMLTSRLTLTDAVCAFVSTVMMWIQGGSGQCVPVQGDCIDNDDVDIDKCVFCPLC